MAVTKALPGFRFVEIQYGDSLQAIAQRELGDATLWPDLIAINDLLPPYLTDDPEAAGPQVRLSGQLLMVPATEAQVDSVADPTLLYGTDISLAQGLLRPGAGGDLELVSGTANLKQALENRISTPLRELLFHIDYGCGAHALKGAAGQPGVLTLAAQYVRSAALSDTRIQDVPSTRAELSGDAISVSASVTPITGDTIDILRTF